MTAYDYYKNRLGFECEELLQELVACSRYGTGKKGDILIRQGEICDTIYLLETGMARGFIIDEGGKESTDCLVRSEWEIVITGLVRQEVNEEAFDSVELVEDSTYFALSLADMVKLREKYPEVTELYLTILERSWENQAQVKRARYTLDATQRYLWFTETYPGVENRMRQKDIASFLNMTTQVLSKIRTKYKSQKMI